MKKIFLILSISTVLLFSSCVHIKDTYVIVTVLDNAGNSIGSGTTVYMFSEVPESGFNATFGVEKTMITTEDGTAEFLLPPAFFVDDSYDQITKVFSLIQVNSEPFVDDSVLCSASANINYGETKNVTLSLK